MGVHENIDGFLNLSPRWRYAVYLGFIVFILVIILIVFKIGESYAISRYELQRSAKEKALETQINDSAQREKGFRSEAEKLVAQNEILKAQNEAQSRILSQNAKRIDTEKVNQINQISNNLNKKYEEIANSSDDVDTQRRLLCAESAQNGLKLSPEFCPN